MHFKGFIILYFLSFQANAQDSVFNIIFRQDFEDDTPGLYRRQEWRQDWNSPAYANGLERTYIVRDSSGNRAMKWNYPKGSVGPSAGGGQFESPISEPGDEIYFSYNIKFKPGFNWAEGGKLPGLRGGSSTFSPGGPKPVWGDGFSNGLMWGHGYGRQDDYGGVYFYTYYQDMQGLYGESRRWDRFRIQTEPERWYNITIRMVMNTIRKDGSGGNYDGIMEGFIDGKLVASYTGFRFRNVSSVHIDKMKIYSFFGGSGAQYAAIRDEWSMIDDIYLFTYARGASVIRGNIPSPPGRVLKLPNLSKLPLNSILKEKEDNGAFSRLTVPEIGDSTFSVSWAKGDAASAGNEQIFLNVNDSSYQVTGDTSAFVRNQLPGSRYKIFLTAKNDEGSVSGLSDTLTVTTHGKDLTPPSRPSGLAVKEAGQDHVQIFWNGSKDNARVVGYKIYINGNLIGTSSVPHYSFRGLDAESTYTVSVLAYDAAGNNSELSDKFEISTTGSDNEPPEAPEGLKAVQITETSVLLTWKRSIDDSGIAGYVIFLDHNVRGTSYRESFMLTGLQPGKSYEISLATFDSKGNKSQISTPIVINTKGKD